MSLQAAIQDKALFWLRWLFLAGAALLALLAEEIVVTGAVLNQTKLLVGLGIGVSGNLALGLAGGRLDARASGIANVALDSLLAALFYWAYGGVAVMLLVWGILAVLTAALRFGWAGIIITLLGVIAISLIALAGIGKVDGARLINWGVSMTLLGGFGALGISFHPTAMTSLAESSWTEREDEALKLRATRERARAIFEMANALSASLDHRKVLQAAQSIGMLGLREELGPQAHLVSAVLLFQGEDNQLRVVTSRGLTRADSGVAVPGRKGVLGLALKQVEPIFAGEASSDPELRYFAGFQDAKSLLIIPLNAGYDVFGAMVFGCNQANAFSDDHVELMNAIGTQATLSLQNAVLYNNLLTEKEKIVSVEEDARKKLSRDLHDGPTQSVAAIAMRVNYIRRLVERQPQQATEELWKIEELARRTTKEIRHMLFTLRPLVLETQGLLAALAQLAEKMQETHDMHVMLKAQPDAEEYLDTNQQGVLFYIVEEAVNNARKHAQSETVWVRLFRREGFIVVEIEDNGIGFDVGAVDSSYDQRDSLGMVNMRERAELIEGTLRIQSAAGRGTKITVLVPVNRTGMVDDTDPIPPLELQSHRSRAQRPIQPLPRPKTGSLGPIKPITNPVEPEAAPPDSPAASAAPNNNSRHISRPRQAERPAILPKTTKPRRPLSPTNE